MHFLTLPIEDQFTDDIQEGKGQRRTQPPAAAGGAAGAAGGPGAGAAAAGAAGGGAAAGEAAAAGGGGGSRIVAAGMADGPIPFEDAENPVMSQVSRKGEGLQGKGRAGGGGRDGEEKRTEGSVGVRGGGLVTKRQGGVAWSCRAMQ